MYLVLYLHPLNQYYFVICVQYCNISVLVDFCLQLQLQYNQINISINLALQIQFFFLSVVVFGDLFCVDFRWVLFNLKFFTSFVIHICIMYINYILMSHVLSVWKPIEALKRLHLLIFFCRHHISTMLWSIVSILQQ